MAGSPEQTKPGSDDSAPQRSILAAETAHWPPRERRLDLPSVPEIKIPDSLNQGGVSGVVGNEKGLFMERRVADIITTHPKVREVVLHAKEDPQDGKGHDITVFFVEDSGIAPIHIQVKSSIEGILKYRNRISKKLRKLGSEMTASEWLILDRTIALNGALVNEQEILYKFILGVGKILKRYNAVGKEHEYIDLFTPPVTLTYNFADPPPPVQ